MGEKFIAREVGHQKTGNAAEKSTWRDGSTSGRTLLPGTGKQPFSPEGNNLEMGVSSQGAISSSGGKESEIQEKATLQGRAGDDETRTVTKLKEVEVSHALNTDDLTPHSAASKELLDAGLTDCETRFRGDERINRWRFMRESETSKQVTKGVGSKTYLMNLRVHQGGRAMQL